MQRLSLKEGTSNPLRDDGHYSGDEGDEHHSEESGGTSHTFFELDQTTANAFDDGDEEENCGSAARRRSAAQNFLACSLLLVVAVILAVLVTHAVDATGNKTELPVDDASSDDADTGPLKILFVGNSFTYGPPPYDREDQHSLNNLPAMFKLVSESMGRAVLTAEDTLGGCTVYTHRPSRNPEACDVEVGSNGDDDDDDNKCQLIDTYRVGANRYCSAPEGISCDSDSYHTCPQLLSRQPYGPWDVVVIQDHSALPTVQAARDLMLQPAFDEYRQTLDLQGTSLQGEGDEGGETSGGWRRPLIASYMTWSYYNGTNGERCPGGKKKGCFPFGTLEQLSGCDADDTWFQKTGSMPCQGYALARGYASLVCSDGSSSRSNTDASGDNSSDVVLIPAGLGWQMARGSPDIPAECRALVDAEYEGEPNPLASLELPLPPSDPSIARWAGEASAQLLFRDKGPDYDSGYCDNGCTIDHHASALGMYLNALIFFATLFETSPIGAAAPNGQTMSGAYGSVTLPTISDQDDIAALQQIAHDTVMPYLDAWWAGVDGGGRGGIWRSRQRQRRESLKET